MPIVAVVHPNAELRAILKRGVTNPYLRVITCRTTQRVEKLLQKELVDAVVADVKSKRPDWFFLLAELYPQVPRFAFSPFRPDDGRLLSECVRSGVSKILVQGVDDAVAGEIVGDGSTGSRLASDIGDAPRLLRLRDPLQLHVWSEVLNRVGSGLQTADIADSMKMSREHLSREFGAGGAPNLKRVIDLVRLLRAADLLQNPGLSVSTVAQILQFASGSHLSSTAKRLTDKTPRRLSDLGPRGILASFLRGKTRSRL
jgi:AraC-like DNA-binding protein